jgi:hypothetical protein
MSTRNYIPDTVTASLNARLAAYGETGPVAGDRLADERRALEDLDVEASRAVSPRRERPARSGFVNDLKLLFAALGAGGSVVPLGDNGRTTRLLSEYAAALRDQ